MKKSNQRKLNMSAYSKLEYFLACKFPKEFMLDEKPYPIEFTGYEMDKMWRLIYDIRTEEK